MDENKKIKRYRKYKNIPYFKYYFSMKKNVFKYALACLKTLLSGGGALYTTGTHFISGYPGAGKTLLMNYIINRVDSSKYFFYTNIDEFNAENVYKIDIQTLFKDKKQQYQLRTKIGNRKLFGLILDEINFNFNKRINQQRDYTDVFVPLVNMIVSHRHQGIPRVYFIGQKLELQDTQLISLFKQQHDIIKTKRRFAYWKYYETDTAIKVPKKLKIINRIKATDDTFLDVGKLKIKLSWFDLESYDTFALKKEFSTLKYYPIDKTKN